MLILEEYNKLILLEVSRGKEIVQWFLFWKKQKCHLIKVKCTNLYIQKLLTTKYTAKSNKKLCMFNFKIKY